MNSQIKIFIGVIAFLILGTIVTVVFGLGKGAPVKDDGQYDTFAQCLSDKGAKFYGTFWCPYCKKQKDMFGSSAKLIPYVECSMPDGRTQTNICKENNIESYPTWVFADGSRLNGLIPLETLAEKTSCVLPQGTQEEKELQEPQGVKELQEPQTIEEKSNGDLTQ